MAVQSGGSASAPTAHHVPAHRPAGSPPPRRTKRRDEGRRPSRLWNAVLPIIGTGTAIAVWWLWVVLFHVRKFIVPSPGDVVDAFHRMPVHLFRQTWYTLQEVLAGYALAMVVGLVLAIVLVSSNALERAVMPIIVALNAIPKVSIAPLLIIWMGFGYAPKIVMVFLISFFPILVSTMTGLTSTPADLGELAASYSASRWSMFVKIRMPWALPHMFVGLKVAITLAVIGAVVAEFAGSDKGIAYVVNSSSAQGETAVAFAGIVLLSVLSVVLFYLVAALERRLLPWVRETSA